MFKFISTNRSHIIKFILTHIVMSVLGIMVGLSVLSIETGSAGISIIALIASVFTIGFMCFMHYDDSFFLGVREGIRHRAEGTKPDLLKGLKIAIIGYLPAILIGIIAIIVILATPEGQDMTPVPMLLFYACQGSFLTLYKLLDYIGPIGYIILTLLPAIISTALGYAVGSQDKTLRGMMGMKVQPPFDGPLERKRKNKDD